MAKYFDDWFCMHEILSMVNLMLCIEAITYDLFCFGKKLFVKQANCKLIDTQRYRFLPPFPQIYYTSYDKIF